MKGRSRLTQKIPHHVAIVMDGNGRWAERQGLPRVEGHRVGVNVVKTMVRCCIEKKISVLSLFAFSCENWQRPVQEVEFLMDLFLQALAREIDELHQNGVRLNFTGDRQILSSLLQQKMQAAEDLTHTNTALTLNVVMNYTGQWDILQAARCIASQVQQGHLTPEDINESLFERYLDTQGLPNPDLFIRTSGEQRISNFFLWQLAYTELYFTETSWPDFSIEEFEKALLFYAYRERRYGKTSSQVQGENHV